MTAFSNNPQPESLSKFVSPLSAGVVTPEVCNKFFNRETISDELASFLKLIPLQDQEDRTTHFLNRALTLQQIDDYLQEVIFKPQADRFSYQLTGDPPNAAQLESLRALGFVDEIRVQPKAEFDTAIVWGGTLAAVENRIGMLLDQQVSFSQIVLLGTNARELDKGDKTHVSETQIGIAAFRERAETITGRSTKDLTDPKNEAEMIEFAWRALVPNELKNLPVLTINTPGRPPEHELAQYKNVPSTQDTFGYLLLFARANQIDLGTRFIAAFSQPHAVRQTVDAEYKLKSVDQPFSLLAGIGSGTNSSSLKLYLQEIAKLVNTLRKIEGLSKA